MGGAGIGHGIGQAGGLGVVAAHDALQFGEFADHGRLQVGFGDPRRLFGIVRVGPNQGRDFAGQGGDAVDAVGLGAKLVVEGDVCQTCGHALHAHLFHRAQVVFPEEPGIRQAGGQHLLVAFQDRGAVISGFGIGHGDEALDPPGLGVAHREEFLMRAHRGLQHLRRQVDEIRADLAHQHHRPFHEARHFGQQRGIGHHLQPGGKGGGAGVGPDMVGAGLRIQHDKGAFQLGAVVVERGDGEAGGGEEAVAGGGVAGGDAVDGQRHGGGPGLVGQQAQDGVQRADPAQRPRAPTHGFRPGESAHGSLHCFGDNRCRCTPRFLDHGEQNRHLANLAHHQLVAFKAGRAQKPGDGGLGRIGARALAVFGQAGGSRRQPLHGQRQPARGAKGPCPGIGQPGLDQCIGHQPFQIGGGLGLHAGRNFFGEQFEQQIGHLTLPDFH